MSAKTGKRPLRSLSAHEKLEAIRRVHDGESKASVARDIGVPESTLRGWCKNENKISYLSRQSSPETEDEPKEKRAKLEDTVQPFNLSLKPNSYAAPNSESLYTPIDYAKDMEIPPKTPQNLSFKNETPKTTAAQVTERERNRAELARLSIELGLNRPEMFSNSPASLAELTANINFLSQWNHLVLQQQLLKQKPEIVGATTTAAATTLSTTNNMVTTSSASSKVKLPKEQQSMDDYIQQWLKAQEAMIGSRSNASHTTAATSSNSNIPMNNAYQNSWFWKWYKQMAFPQQPLMPEKPILYQQLTKDAEKNNENHHQQQQSQQHQQAQQPQQSQQQHQQQQALLPADGPQQQHPLGQTKNNINHNSNNFNKGRSVLDNILLINNNNNNKVNDEHPESRLSQSEALEHGEKFMKWMETCSDPAVTAVHVVQFRSLINNLRLGVERKNGQQPNKTKVRRK